MPETRFGYNGRLVRKILYGTAALLLVVVLLWRYSWEAKNDAHSPIDAEDVANRSHQLSAAHSTSGDSTSLAAPKPIKKWKDAVSDENVKRFGTATRPPIDPEMSIFFYGGRYIETPYRIARKGLAILVNGIQMDMLVWPHRFYRSKEPQIPTGWTRNTSLKTIERWRGRKFEWLCSHLPPQVARKKWIEWLRSLPMIKSIERKAVNEWGFPELKLITFSGESTKIFLQPSEKIDFRLKSREEVIRELEKKMKKLEDHLTGCAYGFEYRVNTLTMTFHRSSALWEKLPEIVDVLYSKDTTNEKARRLIPLFLNGQFMNEADVIAHLSPLLEHFEGKPQLKARMDRIRRERKQIQ